MQYIKIRQIKFATILQVTRYDENDFVKSYNFLITRKGLKPQENEK